MATRLRGAIERTRQRRRTQRQLASEQEALRQGDAANYQSPHRNPFTESSRENYKTYPYDYYSGTDCKLFYGDVWVDDVVGINYSVSQNKTPIYGYASQNFNAIAKGQIIVQGTMTVAFKETGYLNIIQRITETQKQNAYQVLKRRQDISREKAEYKLAKFDPSLNYIGETPKNPQIAVGMTANGSPQLIRQEQTIEEILMNKKTGEASKASLALSRGFNLGEKTRDFEDFAELLEDSIWGDSNGRPLGAGLRNAIKRADEFDYNNAGGIKVGIGQGNNAQYEHVLNLMLTFGDINDFRAEHTLVVINDVHFIGTQQMMSPDGSPIFEEYTFIARDINHSISSELLNNINPIKLDVGIDDLQVARLDDIETIEQKLNQASTSEPWVLTMKSIASFNQFGWRTEQGEPLEVYISMNKGTPLVDRMIEAVEKGFNNHEFADYVNTDKQQYIIDTWFTPTETITMVLEQTIPNTRTYKVIAPVRTGFRAPVIVTREDLFTDISELQEPLEEVGGIIDRNNKYLNEKAKELDTALDDLEEQNAAFGTEDELADYRRRQAKVDRLREERENDRRKTRIGQALQDRRIDRARRAEEEAFRDYVDETLTPREDRSTTRAARDAQADRDAIQAELDKDYERLVADARVNTAQINQYNEAIAEQQAKERREAYEKAHAANLAEIARMKKADRDAAKAKINEEYQTQAAEIDAQIAATQAELDALELEEERRAQDREANRPQSQAPWYAQNRDTVLYSENVASHASRAGKANEPYRRGTVQALDIQTAVGIGPVTYPLSNAELVSYNLETQSGDITGNLPGVEGPITIRFDHVKAVNVRDNDIQFQGSTDDSSLNAIRPLVHIQVKNADFDFQSATTRAYQDAGTNVYDVDANEFYAAKKQESSPRPATWPDQQANREALAEKEQGSSVEGRTGRRLKFDSQGNVIGIINPE